MRAKGRLASRRHGRTAATHTAKTRPPAIIPNVPQALTLINPLGLGVLALLAPLILLYVLRAKRSRRVVSSVWLFREIQRDLRAERRFRRLVPMLPLFIEAMTVVALALAAAGLARTSELSATDGIAIVFDTSASMGATDGTSTRMDRAKDATRAIVRELAGRGVLVVEAAKEPRLASAVERDPGRVMAALDALSPRDESSDLAAAVLIAEERIGKLPGSHRVVLVTDVNAEVPPRSRLPLQIVRVGEKEDNVGLSRLELRRTTPPGSARDRVDALAIVQSFADRPLERFVSLSRRGAESPFASRRVSLAPGQKLTVALAFDATSADTGAGIIAELSPSDALRTDDRAFSIVPPGPRLPVVMTPEGKSPWLARALAADPAVDLTQTPFPPSIDAVPKGALVVATGACTDAPNGADVLIVAPPAGDCLGTRIGAAVKAPGITSWSESDPRLRFISLDEVHVSESLVIEAPRTESLVRAGDRTLVADLGLFGRTGTVVGFDLAQSDWPLRASFVLFVRNVTELARANRSHMLGAAGRTGESLRVAAPLPDGATVAVHGPEGDLPARLVRGVVMGEAPSRAGFYDVVSAGSTVATVALTADAGEESDLRRTPTADGPAARGAPGSRTAPAPAPLTSIFAAIALACVLAEASWLLRRKAPGGSRRSGGILVIAATLAATVAIAVYAFSGASRFVEARLSFEHPAFLLVGVAMLGAGLFASVRRRERPAAQVMVVGFLALATLTATLAASGPGLRLGSDTLSVIVAIDRSRSMDLVPSASAQIERALGDANRGMLRGDRIGVVAFASEAALEEPLRTAREPRSPQRAALGRDGTDLAAGIRRALGEAPPDSATRVVLLTDGVPTRGDTLGAARAAALAGVPIDVLALEQQRRPSVRVETLRAPQRAAVDEPIDLRVTYRSTSDVEGNAFLVVDGQEREAGRVRVHSGEDVLFLRSKADTPGLHEYEVRLSPVDPAADVIADDNVQTAFVRVSGRSSAVVIDEDPGHAAPIQRALEAAAFDVEVAPATRAPSSTSELLRHDLVVLGNVPARDLSPEQLERAAACVEHLGEGLLLFGGKRSMGPGGYAGTPIERVSPVSFELRNERRRARLAEVIAIDYSGSMAMAVGKHTKLELANEAAVRSAELLGSLDRLGVLHVDTTATWTIPLAALTDKTDLARRVRSVGPGGGGIYVDRALEVAYAALDRESVEQKHVLLFSDGDDAEERQAAPSLARAARTRGITTSVVALGRGQDTAGLEKLSREGEGRFYLIEDAARLPAVFAEETTIAAGSAYREEPFRATLATPVSATRGVDFAEAPALGGYAVTTAKPRAEVALLAADGDPLLAVWSAGIGRAAAFTSDYAEPWGTEWRGWAGAARLFAQLARSLSRNDDDPAVTLDARTTTGGLHVLATALADDGSLDATRTLTATVVGPDGFVRGTPLSPTSPGTYEGLVPLPHAGTYIAQVTDDATHANVGTVGARLSSGDELEPTATDHALLDRITLITEGRTRTSLDGIFADRPKDRRSFHLLSPWLAALGALAMLLSAAARRLSSLGRGRQSATDAVVLPDDVATTNDVATPAERSAAAAPPTLAETLLSRRRRRR